MKISVIVPMFNSENFISECINSILSQTFTDFELILVDDCSTDSTLDIVSRYDDPRIKILQTLRNGKDWTARNLGLQFASGEYVYFVDHDDILLSDALEILWNGVEISHADTIHFNFYIADSNPVGSKNRDGKMYKIEDTAPPWKFLLEDVEWRLFHRGFTLQVMPWQKLIRRKFLIENELYFPPIWISSDSLLFLAELCLARKIFVVDGGGYIYRNNRNSQMKSDSEKKFRQAIENFLPFNNYIEEIFSKKLVSPLSRELQLKYKIKFFRDLNFYLARKIYDQETPLDEIEKILDQKIRQGLLLNSELIRMLFHLATANYITRKSKMKGREIFE